MALHALPDLSHPVSGDKPVTKTRFNAPTLMVIASVWLAACSSTPVAQAPTPAPVAVAAPAAPAPAVSRGGAAQPVAASSVATVTLPPYLDPKSPLSSERSVYFDFDMFAIKGDYNALIERHGKYLASRPALAIKVEGNADERGSAEYNLALGQKRAQAVLHALKVYGVKDGQVEAVSWGGEHPRATGHDEAAWAQNRRADLVYPKQ